MNAVLGQLSALVAMSSGDPRLDEVIRLACGRALRLPPLPVEADLFDDYPDEQPVVAAFAEQFATDVSGIGQNQRARFTTALGDRTFRIAAAVFIADFGPRVRAGFAALGLGEPYCTAPVEWDHETDPSQVLLGEFVPAVARLRALDPLTTEVVRLRGAIAYARCSESSWRSWASGSGAWSTRRSTATASHGSAWRRPPTTSSAADWRPRRSPPAASPASSAVSSRSASGSGLRTNASAIASSTAGERSRLPWTLHPSP